MRRKIALIGGGQIGGVLAQLIAAKELADVVMVDIVEGLPQGKMLDIAEAAHIGRYDSSVNGSNSYEALENSDICIVTAGVPRKPGMSRDDLLSINSKIISSVAENIKKYAPNSIVIVISNPLDAMVTLMQKVTQFPHNRVIGQAGVLDSSRFATFLAWELNVSAKDVHAMVLGGHGDTMVPIIRYANVNGVPAQELLERKHGEKAKDILDAIIKRTRDAGGEVVALLKTGSAFYSPAAAAVEMAEAILKNQRRVLAIAAFLNGEFGVSGYYMGVPAILGENGAESVLEFQLNEEEKQMFEVSLNSVKKNVEDMKRLGF
ncbi:malate dehydrogenase [bacterium]|nr:malate dehydrogenase [bacterium]